ncbi:hypothetical protein OUZ56_030354 [Daphnia magna]|uniref:Uncharacterized protein n=1 Tax=Daphnia magna TaxID=35525 RepID=A0ABQ9ZR20_9CRUS|nr:hypothetical protein OUZ56_030354 [Daphnia magna]
MLKLLLYAPRHSSRTLLPPKVLHQADLERIAFCMVVHQVSAWCSTVGVSEPMRAPVHYGIYGLLWKIDRR